MFDTKMVEFIGGRQALGWKETICVKPMTMQTFPRTTGLDLTAIVWGPCFVMLGTYTNKP